MEISPILLSKLLFFSFLFGIALGILNDVFRITRTFFGVKYSERDFSNLYSVFRWSPKTASASKHKIRMLSLVIFLEDLLLMAILGAGIVILNYYFNDGRLRLFTIFSCAVGGVLYFFTVGKLIILLFEPIVIIIRSLIYWSIKGITAPFKYAFIFFSRIAKNIYKKIRKKLEKYTNIRYNKRVVKTYLEQSEVGFVGGILDEG